MAEPRPRRAPGLAAAALGPLLLVGCGDDPGGDTVADPSSSTSSASASSSGTGAPADTAPGDGEPDGVDGTLDAEVEAGAAGIDVRWRWTNDGDRPVYVVDGAPSAAGTLSTTSAYVVGLASEPDDVQVGERLFAQPDSDTNQYEAPFYAGVTQVQPGRTIERQVTVPAPVEEAKPFGGYYADGEAAVPDDPARVTFCVGVLVPPYADTPILRDDGEVRTAHGSTDQQTLFCADPVPVD